MIGYPMEEKIAQALGDPTRLKIMQILYTKDKCTVADLASMLNKHRSTIFRHLKLLEKAELVERIESEEGVFYLLSSKGKNVLEALEQEVSNENKLLSSYVKPANPVTSLKSNFRKILAHCLCYFPAIVIASVGVISAIRAEGVMAISRIIWTLIFLSAALLWVFFFRKIILKKCNVSDRSFQ